MPDIVFAINHENLVEFPTLKLDKPYLMIMVYSDSGVVYLSDHNIEFFGFLSRQFGGIRLRAHRTREQHVWLFELRILIIACRVIECSTKAIRLVVH